MNLTKHILFITFLLLTKNAWSSCWGGLANDENLISTKIEKSGERYLITIEAPYFYKTPTNYNAYNPIVQLTTQEGVFELNTVKIEVKETSAECSKRDGIFLPRLNINHSENDKCLSEQRDNDKFASLKSTFFVSDINKTQEMQLNLVFLYYSDNSPRSSSHNCTIYISNSYSITSNETPNKALNVNGQPQAAAH